MANATTKVAAGTVRWGDDTIKRGAVSTAQTWYTGAMTALNASGFAVKCDDTSGIRFDGVIADAGSGIVVFSGGSDGDQPLIIERPWRLNAYIAAAAAGDEGKPVYAKYDNEVAYSTSNSILVGWVDQVLSATAVLITPLYAPLVPVAIASNTLGFAGTTGANTLTMPDNLADAFSVKEGSNSYLTFVTTDASEAINLKKNTTLAGTLVITSTSATAFEVGPNGATNPTLLVVCSTSIAAGGLKVTGAADAAGVAVAAIGSNTNEPLTFDAKGSGLISIGTVSTGGVVVRTKVATVAAAGTVIGNATATLEGYTYVTGANNVAGIQLPTSVVGKVVRIQNTVATALLLIYPPASSQINAKGVNNVYNIPNAATREFVCVSTTLWYAAPETIA